MRDVITEAGVDISRFQHDADVAAYRVTSEIWLSLDVPVTFQQELIFTKVVIIR